MKKILTIAMSVILACTMTGCNTAYNETNTLKPIDTIVETEYVTDTTAPVTTYTVETIDAEPAETTAETPEPQEMETMNSPSTSSKYGFADDDLSDLFGGKPTLTTTATKPTATTTKPSTSGKYSFADDDLSDLFGGKPASTPSNNKPATTTTKSTQTTEPVETKTIPVLSFETTDFVQYTYANNKLKISGYYPTIYDFASSKSVGIGGDNKTIRFAEMDYGVTAEINRNTLTYKVYNNSSKTVSAKSTVIEDDNTSTTITTATTSNKKYDISKLSNGLYRLRTKFSTNKTLDLYFLINGNTAYLCSAEGLTSSQIKSYRDRREKIYQLIKAEGITVNDCLDTSQLCYPCYPYSDKYRCDTQRWIDLSNQICKSSWTAEHKLYAIHEWMTANLAYDYYRIDVLGMTREKYFSDWSGTYATYTNHVGVCVDFSNILLTMCRAQGIPTSTIITKTHIWNVVYLDGVWTEIDMTYDINRAVYGKDTSKVSNATDIYDYEGYLSIIGNKKTISEMLYANAAIYTIAFATGKDDCHGMAV